jgi:Sec-independent protein translocase protein TatA
MWEVVLILVVALIVLGPKQLVETARVVGKVYREILKMAGDIRSSIDLDSLTPHEPRKSAPYQPPSSPTYPDRDTMPPERVKSGPDFYADLLESSKEEPKQEEPEATASQDEKKAEVDAPGLSKTTSTEKT